MAMQFDSGGWQPRYDYSAFLSGTKNSMAEQAAEEEQTKSILANLLSAGKLPNEVAASNLEGERARGKLSDPNYLPWERAGYVGQMMSQDASGRLKQATYNDELANTTQELQTKVQKGKLEKEEIDHYLNRIADLKQRQANGTLGQTGTSGFPMQQFEPQLEYQSEFNPNYGNEGRGYTPLPILKNESAMKSSMGTDYRSGSKPYDLDTIDKEIKQFGDKTGELAKERARIVTELAQGGGGEQPGSIMQRFAQSTQSGNTNKYLQGIPGADPYHEGMMSILMDTPKFRQELAKGEQKTDSAEQLLNTRLEAQARLANLKQAAKSGDKNAEQALLNVYKLQLANREITPATYQVLLEELQNSKTVRPESTIVNPGVAAGTLQSSTQNVPRVGQARKSTETSSATTKGGNKYTIVESN